MNKILKLFGRAVRIAAFLIKLVSAYACAAVLRLFWGRGYRDLWLIAERGDDARDNGFFFYEYLRCKHPDINVCYVITPESADRPKVEALGRWVAHNSFAHFIMYALCRVRLSSSAWGGDLPYNDYFKKLPFCMSRRKPFIFLKHGIIKDYLPQHCAGGVDPDLYVCGAKPEFDYVTGNFGHPDGVVRYTGLARYDNLHGITTKKQILVMPTFRKWLQGKSSDEVAASRYVTEWNGVLQNKRLQQCLEASGLTLIFYPHYVMQKHIGLFDAHSPNIVIAPFDDYDVQTLLIESKLLVTDFSSVFFDFGYMGKPVIHYQFDREQYINEHYDYTKGYFDYDRDGFGEVATHGDRLVDLIIGYAAGDFALSEQYKQRIDRFFPLCDNHNCDRIFAEIERVLN